MSTPETTSLLLEIGCEEIPARFLEKAQQDLGSGLLGVLGEARLLPEGAGHEAQPVLTYSTPRRLVAYVRSILEKQPERSEEVLGPPVKAAFDKEGKPTRAAEAFAEKNKVTLEALFRLTTPKGEYLAFCKAEPGRFALDVLTEMLPAVIRDLAFPKSMVWAGKGSPRFARPVRWIVALLGEGSEARVVPFEFADVRTGSVTYGHRLGGADSTRVTGIKEYLSFLEHHWVLTDPERRKERVRDNIKGLLDGRNLVVVPDDALENWVVNSTEWPVPVMGSFDPRYLVLRREVLETVMRDHQKYFAVDDKAGNLQPQFVTVLNVPDDPEGLIRRGHERVLAARFADAEFFWNTDQKVSLTQRVELVRRVTYHEKLGTYADKIKRMRVAAGNISDQLEVAGQMAAEQRGYALRAIDLCKCDLTTQMVQEFTELQGIVGGLYAKAQGEVTEVADAIYDHYRPVNIEDSCPRSVVGAVVSLADKLDSVVAGFSAGLEPTGSSDPFGLRRAGNGIVQLCLDALQGLDLYLVASKSIGCVDPALMGQGTEGLWPKVESFFRERMEFYFRDVLGLRYDTVRAVLTPTMMQAWWVPSVALSRTRALEHVRDTEDFLVLAAAAKRTRNILNKSASAKDVAGGSFDPDRLLKGEVPERELCEAYLNLKQRLNVLTDNGNHEEAFRVMGAIRPQVDRFFDKVLVMAEDREVRSNRLHLLVRLNQDVFTRLADLAEIAGEPRSTVATGMSGKAGKT